MSVTCCSSSVCNSICEVLSATEDVWARASARQMTISICICLIGFYKCESFGLRNPTSRPRTAAILPATISRWLRPAIDHGCDSFSFSLSIKLVLMIDSRWASALAIRRERQGRFLPSVRASTPTGSMPFCDLIQQAHTTWGGVHAQASTYQPPNAYLEGCRSVIVSISINQTSQTPKYIPSGSRSPYGDS